MSAKDKKSEVFSYFWKSHRLCEFLARSLFWTRTKKSIYNKTTIYLNKGFKHIFAFVLMQMCACLKEHMRVVAGKFCLNKLSRKDNQQEDK